MHVPRLAKGASITSMQGNRQVPLCQYKPYLARARYNVDIYAHDGFLYACHMNESCLYESILYTVLTAYVEITLETMSPYE